VAVAVALAQLTSLELVVLDLLLSNTQTLAQFLSAQVLHPQQPHQVDLR
jgi:hypothetical protein